MVVKHQLDALVCCGTWHPSANELLLGMVDSKVVQWPGVVPSHLLQPHMPVPSAALQCALLVD